MKRTLLTVTALTYSIFALADPITINLNTQLSHPSGMVGQMTRTFSVHDIEIINQTDEQRTFKYSYSLCVTNHGCQEISNTVNVAAKTTWNNHRENYIDASFNSPGNYPVNAKTMVNNKSKTASADIWIRA